MICFNLPIGQARQSFPIWLEPLNFRLGNTIIPIRIFPVDGRGKGVNSVENMTTMEDTLFLPVLGRIYASEKFPHILKDEKALELKAKLPEHLKGRKLQNQYAALAGAVRSANFDRYIQNFLKRNPDGVIVQLGCGLETTFYRCDNGRAIWYDVDFPDAMKIRKTVLRESEREHFFAGNPFLCEWLEEIRKFDSQIPVLVTAGGLLHYFDRKKIIGLMQKIQKFGNVELIFDALNERGMKRMAGYMKQTGHEASGDYFHVEQAADLAQQIGGAQVLLEEKYYAHTDTDGLGFLARSSIRKSDQEGLMKIIALKL